MFSDGFSLKMNPAAELMFQLFEKIMKLNVPKLAFLIGHIYYFLRPK